MEREQLEYHRDAVRNMREAVIDHVSPENLAAVINVVAVAVEAMLNDQLVAGEHAAAVAQMIKTSGEPRMVIYPGKEVEQSGPRVIKTGPVEADPRD